MANPTIATPAEATAEFGGEQTLRQTDLSGIFVYEKQGFLAGLEVYGLAGDAPKVLPSPDALRPIDD